MADEETPIHLAPLHYADPGLPSGTTFVQRQYPSDRAGFFNPARVVVKDGTISLEPGPIRLRMAGMLLLLGVCIAGSSYREIHRRFEFPVVAVIFAIIVITYGIRQARRRNRTPWLVIDSTMRQIKLPRARKAVRFADVVRVQVVSFGRIGWSTGYLGYHGDPGTGEVQIVFNTPIGQETWCVVAWPDKDVLRRFVRSFHESSGVPVARATHLTSGEWSVEPFDSSGNEKHE